MNFMRDVINQAVDFKLYELHTCLPGQIKSYDHVKKQATVQPCIKKTLANGSFLSMPLLTNVPVLMPFFNGVGLSVPVNLNDYCLIVFSERSIDQWLTSGGEVDNTDPRIFDLSDGIAIPGLMPTGQSSGIANNTDLILSNGAANVTIAADGTITVKNAFGTILIDRLGGFKVQNQAGELFTVLIDTLTILNTTPPFYWLIHCTISAINGNEVNLMTLDLALDPGTHDLLLTNFDLVIIDGGPQLMQNLKIRLLFFLGEWFLDITRGIPYFEEILIKNPNQARVESILKEQILDTENVLDMLEFSLSFDPVIRQLSVDFAVTTDFGVIDINQGLLI